MLLRTNIWISRDSRLRRIMHLCKEIELFIIMHGAMQRESSAQTNNNQREIFLFIIIFFVILFYGDESSNLKYQIYMS